MRSAGRAGFVYPAARMRRFEFSDGKSNKFWEIEVAGSDGRETSKQFGSPAAAAKQAASAIASKLKKGYAEVAEGESAGAEPAASTPAEPETPPATETSCVTRGRSTFHSSCSSAARVL